MISLFYFFFYELKIIVTPMSEHCDITAVYYSLPPFSCGEWPWRVRNITWVMDESNLELQRKAISDFMAKEKRPRDLKVSELRVCPGNRNHSLSRETKTSHR